MYASPRNAWQFYSSFLHSETNAEVCLFQMRRDITDDDDADSRTKVVDNLKTALRTQPMR